MKTCKRCGQTKDDSAFSKSGFCKDGKTRKGDGRMCVCKACILAAHHRRIDALPEHERQAYYDGHKRRSAEWRARKPHHYRAHHANLQAKRRGATGVLSAGDVQAAWTRWGGKCWICGDAATQVDHFRPVNKQAGGTNTADNIRPICADCNHKRSHRWHGEDIAAREAVLLKQLKDLLK
jgi:5-methylcytosine-specific restriction endonuclease McrA